MLESQLRIYCSKGAHFTMYMYVRFCLPRFLHCVFHLLESRICYTKKGYMRNVTNSLFVIQIKTLGAHVQANENRSKNKMADEE